MQRKCKNLVIEISNLEKNFLVSRGCRWHRDIMASLSRAHYYAKDCEKVNNLLKEYRSQYVKKIN